MISSIYNSVIPLVKLGSRKGKNKYKIESDYNKQLDSLKKQTCFKSLSGDFKKKKYIKSLIKKKS